MTQPTLPQDQESGAQDLCVSAAPSPTHAMPEQVAEPSFGSRLRAAREAKALSMESCAQALKLPARLLRQLEDDQYDGIDYQVYLGSYITKYGRYLGLDDALIQAEVTRLRRQEEPPLVATGGISHSRYLLERYATAATYVVLTAVFVVPMVWLGVHGPLNRDISQLAPLDAAPVAQQELPVDASSAGVAGVAGTRTSPTATPNRAENDQPLLASMVPNLSADTVNPPAPSAPIASDANGDGHRLSISLDDASWVEVLAADGSRLEYGLLPAGTRKTYQSEQSLEVRLGNASGAEVRVDGKTLPLDAYRRANVAHFRLDLQDGKVVPRGA